MGSISLIAPSTNGRRSTRPRLSRTSAWADPDLHRRAAKEARHVPLGQGAAATWPEESYVQGRIDGTPGRRVARSGSFTRRPLEKQVSTPTHRKAAILLPPSDISNWRKS